MTFAQTTRIYHVRMVLSVFNTNWLVTDKFAPHVDVSMSNTLFSVRSKCAHSPYKYSCVLLVSLSEPHMAGE